MDYACLPNTICIFFFKWLLTNGYTVNNTGAKTETSKVKQKSKVEKLEWKSKDNNSATSTAGFHVFYVFRIHYIFFLSQQAPRVSYT